MDYALKTILLAYAARDYDSSGVTELSDLRWKPQGVDVIEELSRVYGIQDSYTGKEEGFDDYEEGNTPSTTLPTFILKMDGVDLNGTLRRVYEEVLKENKTIDDSVKKSPNKSKTRRKKSQKKSKSKKSELDDVLGSYELNTEDGLKAYMARINQIPVLSLEDETDLANRYIESGRTDEGARYTLIYHNLRLVGKIAHDFKGKGLELSDLVSEGNIGLIRAVDKFDPSKGAKLSSYASWWIIQHMRRAIARFSKDVRIPIQTISKIYKLKNARRKLYEKNEREPTKEELKENLEWITATMNTVLQAEKTLTQFSLDKKIEDDEGKGDDIQNITPDPNSPTPTEEISSGEELKKVRMMIEHEDFLDDTERSILRLRYGLGEIKPYTLNETGEIVGFTRERVRQIQVQALEKLREYLTQGV